MVSPTINRFIPQMGMHHEKWWFIQQSKGLNTGNWQKKTQLGVH
jgi:hypothetical protein